VRCLACPPIIFPCHLLPDCPESKPTPVSSALSKGKGLSRVREERSVNRKKALNAAYRRNETGATLDFVIPPAYYQITWFAALSTSLMRALIWTAHRVRVRIIEKHQLEISAPNERLMKAQEQQRIRIAGELHDGGSCSRCWR